MFHVKHIYVKNAEASLILKKMTLNLKKCKRKNVSRETLYVLVN